MRTTAIAIGMLLGIVLNVGCQPAVLAPSNSPEPTASATPTANRDEIRNSLGVAVIDLKEFARLTGERERLQAVVQQRETDLNERLQLLQMGYEEEVETLRNTYGDAATAEQQTEIKQKTAQFNASLLEQRERAQREFNEFKATMELEFLNRVRPVALKTARELGLSVVLQASQTLAYDDSVDITAATVTRWEAGSEGTNDSRADSAARTPQTMPGGGAFRPLK